MILIFNQEKYATLTKGSTVPTTTLSDFENQLQNFITDKLETVRSENCKDGTTPTINVQATNTLDVGSNATVTNNGTDTDVQLVFGIPKNQDGANGISPTVQVGNVSALASGSQATVTNSGDNTNLILNFGIPQGKQGIQGEQGPKGDTGATGPQGQAGKNGIDGKSATIKIGKVTTVDSSKNVSLTNAGTDLNTILNFSIPKGAKGATGPAGKNGTSSNGDGIKWNVTHLIPCAGWKLSTVISATS